MTYQVVSPDPSARTDFLHSERVVFLVGALGVGGVTGFIAALALGRQDFWTLFLAGAPVLGVVLCLSCATYLEARQRGAIRCAAMAACHAGALILWPLFMTFHPLAYAMAPAVAVVSVVGLALCWTASPAAIYRAGAQAALVAALAAHQGAVLVFGA